MADWLRAESACVS